MQYIQGIFRHQLQMSSLEDKITADNIEAFVNLSFTCLLFVLVFSDFQFILCPPGKTTRGKAEQSEAKA